MELVINRRFNEKDLPDMQAIREESRKRAAGIVIPETLFMKTHGVRSEAEYKRKMMAERRVMTHAHIGWADVNYTADAFHQVYDTLHAEGYELSRFGVCLDGSMGVPERYRDRVIAGSGQVYHSPDEWKILPNEVPVAVHMGDHMIGSLNSTENVCNALNGGVTTIGNISHYFSYEYAGFDMELERTIDTCTAIGVMGLLRDKGTIIHSNLDDGFGGQLHDVANLVGWARLERYFVEDLLGGGMNHCFGNLFSDPILRIIFSKAMWDINTYKTPGSMIYGNTTDFGANFPSNYSALASFTMADIIAQRKWPTGCAVTGIPVTEAIRVPSVQEIIDAHMSIKTTMEKAEYYAQYLDFDRIEEQANTLVVAGNTFFERVINALDDLGVDIQHPGQVMAMLKAIGAEQLEINFGAGKKDPDAMRGRVPVWPTNIVRKINDIGDELISSVEGLDKKPLAGVNVVMASTDIHIFGKEVIKRILREAGANIYDLDQSVPTQEVVDTAVETESKVLCISTHNGMAYGYAKELSDRLTAAGLCDVLVIMGGLMNEALPGKNLPEDVSGLVAELGFNVDNNAEKIVDVIARHVSKTA